MATAMVRVSLPLIARQSPATALGEGSLIRQRTRVQFPSPPPLPLVAQLERAAGFYPDGCRFESCRGGMCFDDRTKRSVLRDVGQLDECSGSVRLVGSRHCWVSCCL